MSTIQQCEMIQSCDRWHNDVTFPCHLHSKQHQATLAHPIAMLTLTSQCQTQLNRSGFCTNLFVMNNCGMPLLPSGRHSCRTSHMDSVGANTTTLHHNIFRCMFNTRLMSKLHSNSTSNSFNSGKRKQAIPLILERENCGCFCKVDKETLQDCQLNLFKTEFDNASKTCKNTLNLVS